MKKINKVLILVVVEDVLVQTVTVLSASGITVLILVVVEDVLVHENFSQGRWQSCVLILVVVEDVLVLTNELVMPLRQLS